MSRQSPTARTIQLDANDIVPLASGTDTASPASTPRDMSYDTRTGAEVKLAMPVYSTASVAETAGQWHLGFLGDITKIWQDFTGKGVKVGVFDDGIQGRHWDLAPNYDAANHLNVDGFVVDGNWDGPYHGTAVAGLIAAARNDRGGVGIAYDAKLSGISIYSDWEPSYVDGHDFWKALEAASHQYDVVNNSWGGGGSSLDTSTSRSNPDSAAARYAKGWAALAEQGRDGLGTISVKSAGNSAADVQSEGGDTTRYTISVGAYRQVDGVATSYSNSGSYLLVSAPSSDRLSMQGTYLVTTDLLGDDGINWYADINTGKIDYSKSDYTNAFGGTSASGPIVSGVVSLMLDANDQLGWRDVRTILAQSAKMPIAFDTGPVSYTGFIQGADRTVMMNESQFALSGDAANVNGGSLHYSNDYGYGAVDGYAAVRMAEVWSLFGAAKTSANEVHATVATNVGLTAHGDASAVPVSREAQGGFLTTPVRFTFEVGEKVDLEHVDLTLSFLNRLTIDNGSSASTYDSDLTNVQIRVIAPDGTTAFTAQPGTMAGVDGAQEFTFGLASFQGVESKGTWTLEFATYARTTDQDGQSAVVTSDLTINSLKMDLYGAAPTNDDVYSYTDEFFTMAAITGQSDRTVLVDSNGGIDWINAAAVSGDVVLDLGTTGGASFGGTRAFSLQRGTLIENAVTGDGNDKVTGNASANKLYGMRGDDKLYGLAGNDTIDGGAGNDWIDGGKGNDILTGGAGNDTFLFDNKGTSGVDRITDFSAGDKLMLTAALRDSNRDGIIAFGRDGILNLDKSSRGDKLLLDGVNPDTGLKFAGMENGYYVYVLNTGDVDGLS
ncbi:S8 family serine peptidase [Sphingomonas sp. T9W2]|uniref:S8 family serine peptidase n=1 Tax=Sphingomonas sp. T9W2 TaxID=3143183 RepID=UPI0031F4D42B